jgi:aminoglycoside phosphotransferase (APT) family kinase protein
VTREKTAVGIRRELEHWYQQRAALSEATITEFGTPQSGVVNETYVHSVSYLRDSKRLSLPAVLRIQPANSDTPIPNVDVGQQAFVLRHLSKLPELLTPEVLWHEADAKWLGRPFYVMERMRGEAVFDEGKVPGEAAVLRSMYEQAIAQLTRIHAVDWERAGLRPLFGGTKDLTPLRQQLSAYRSHLDAASTEKKYPLLEAAFDYLDENIPDGSPPVLNWGDARIGNLLYDGEELTAVLDWEIAEITAREVDVGWFIFFERFLRNDGIDERPGAMNDEEIVALYERQAGVKLADLDYYQRWAAFRLAVMRLRAGQADIRRGLESPESRVDEVNFGSIELARLFGFPDPE